MQKVQQVSSVDLAMNGLELESVSLTGLDQTSIEHFNANNAFDAEGLTKLTEQIELRKKSRNDIEQDTRVQIEAKNLEAQRQSFLISRDSEFARLEQEREIEMRRAEQSSEVARQQSERQREAEQARIEAKQLTDAAQIEADRAVQEAKIAQAQADIDAELATDVLIIEDEPVIAADIEALVRELGHNVVDIAATRSEAIEAVAKKAPGLVLADIQLADGSSGIDAVKDILGQMNVPVIFITAFPERLLTGERPEPTFLITKPFQPETVKAAIGQALFFHPRRTAKAA